MIHINTYAMVEILVYVILVLLAFIIYLFYDKYFNKKTIIVEKKVEDSVKPDPINYDRKLSKRKKYGSPRSTNI